MQNRPVSPATAGMGVWSSVVSGSPSSSIANAAPASALVPSVFAIKSDAGVSWFWKVHVTVDPATVLMPEIV